MQAAGHAGGPVEGKAWSPRLRQASGQGEAWVWDYSAVACISFKIGGSAE